MQTVIVDTDVAIDYLRGLEYAGKLMQRLWKGNTAYLSILSAYELYAGMKEGEHEDTEKFIAACTIEPLTMEVARKSGEIYRHYRKKGMTLTSIDCLVHATAIVMGHKIATRNEAHYPDRKILLPL